MTATIGGKREDSGKEKKGSEAKRFAKMEASGRNR